VIRITLPIGSSTPKNWSCTVRPSTQTPADRSVRWATQVLETLAKEGYLRARKSPMQPPSSALNASCSIKTRTPFRCIRVLADIFNRMQAHQKKKCSMLRQFFLLRLPSSPTAASYRIGRCPHDGRSKSTRVEVGLGQADPFFTAPHACTTTPSVAETPNSR
jgi:hypothetical protein